MTDFKYKVHLTVAARGRSQSDVMDLVERARLQAGGREPVFGGRTAGDDDTGSEPGVMVAFELLSADDDELARVVGAMGEWLENQEQAPVLAARIASKKEEPPMTVDGRGLTFDPETHTLTIRPEADRLELTLMQPHETEPGIIAVVATHGPWGRWEQALVVQRVVFEGLSSEMLDGD